MLATTSLQRRNAARDWTSAAVGVVIAAMAAACSVEPVPDHPATGDTVAGQPAAAVDTVLTSFICDDVFRFTVRFEGDSATLFLPDTTLALERSPAATGVRFTRAGVEFWQRGNEGMLDFDGTHYASCQAREGADPFTAARMRGVVFRAVGEEPGWYLEIEPAGMIVFVGDYGDRREETLVPIPVREGSRTEYHAVTATVELRVFIEDEPCVDVMSGEPFPATAVVIVNGDEYRGCGRWLD